MKKILYDYPIFINLIQYCNFFCSYCYVDSSNKHSKESFVTKNWRNILEQCSKLEIPEIRLAGGEPLFCNDIEKICNSIKACNIDYSVVTNGVALKKHIPWLSQIQPKTLWLSFHPEFVDSNLFSDLLQIASGAINNIGVNIFYDDLYKNEALRTVLQTAKFQRIKIIYKTELGRHIKKLNSPYLSKEAHLFLNELSAGGKEVRIESPLLERATRGSKSCALHHRPLITINFDGSVHECCVLANNSKKNLGNLQTDTLDNIIDSYFNAKKNIVPCHDVLRGIDKGHECCPLALITI